MVLIEFPRFKVFEMQIRVFRYTVSTTKLLTRRLQ